MNFNDIFKKSFLNAIYTGDVSLNKIIVVIAVSCVFAAYIFLVYRLLTRKTFYNKNFNISLAANTVIVAAIIMTIQSSIVISLGMVGALSIVRFRTAIKDPMDLTFLFWSISVGIICGAGLPGIALVTSAVLTVGILILNAIPVAKTPLLLIINANNKGIREQIIKAVSENTKIYHIKAQTM
ncbi:MAG: DUF4956 domain-containing protein, partial [Oscillospiraceae bacterium]|nr:DUF4956 domain-containing protein [Candidatus Equicaccousia limihippi]